MRKCMRTLLPAAMMFTFAVSQPVLAAEELPIQGREYMPKEAEDTLRTCVEHLPETVVEAYLAFGGSVTVTLEPVSDWTDRTVDGLYSVVNKDIRLRYDKNQTDTEIGNTFLHEIGHFVYDATLSGWSEEMQERFRNERESLIAESGGYLTDEEAFAFLYSANYSEGPLCGRYEDFLQMVEEILPQSGMSEFGKRSVVGTGHSYVRKTE